MRKKQINWTKYLSIITIIMAIVASPLVIATIQNNEILNTYAEQLYALPLPANTKLISQTKNVGNLYGTGNHLDFAATMEVESFLSEDKLSKYYNTIFLKSANEISGMKFDNIYSDIGAQHKSIKIEVIPKNQAILAFGSSRIYIKSDVINSNFDKKLFIIQTIDTHYAPGWDLRAH